MRLQNRRVFGVSALALGAALVLAGCGAGQLTQTDSQQPAVNGTHADVGKLALRNVAFQFPKTGGAYAKDASAALAVTIVNNGTADDELVAVTSDAAGAPGVITGSKVIVAGHSLVIAPTDVSIEPPAATLAPAAPSSSSANPGSPSSPASSESAPNSAAPSAAAKPGEGGVTLPKLKSPFWPGMAIKVTFSFKLAGTVTIDVPIAPAQHDRASVPEAHEAKPAEGH